MDFTEFDNLILSINNIKEGLAEQYDNENISLNQTIIELTQMLKERNYKIEELEKQVADNKFNEDNYNKVSILRILSKENDDLKKQNQQLMASLNYRTEESYINIELVTNEETNEELVTNEETNEEETEEEVTNEETNEELVTNEETNEEETEEEVTNEETNEVSEVFEKIIHKTKEYYLIDDIIYKIKKNSEKGKKVGKMVNGKVKLTVKKKNGD